MIYSALMVTTITYLASEWPPSFVKWLVESCYVWTFDLAFHILHFWLCLHCACSLYTWWLLPLMSLSMHSWNIIWHKCQWAWFSKSTICSIRGPYQLLWSKNLSVFRHFWYRDSTVHLLRRIYYCDFCVDNNSEPVTFYSLHMRVGWKGLVSNNQLSKKDKAVASYSVPTWSWCLAILPFSSCMWPWSKFWEWWLVKGHHCLCTSNFRGGKRPKFWFRFTVNKYKPNLLLVGVTPPSGVNVCIIVDCISEAPAIGTTLLPTLTTGVPVPPVNYELE